MSETKLAAQARSEFGKGAARRLRRADQIPAVVYGHGTEPVHIALPGHETMLALKHRNNALLALDVEGDDLLVIVKETQVDPIKMTIEHLDLILVKSGEKIAVDVALILEGETVPGTTHLFHATAVSVEAEATHLPESITVSIEGLKANDKILASQIEMPTGVSLLSDGHLLIVAVNEAQVAPAEDEVATPAAAPAAAEA